MEATCTVYKIKCCAPIPIPQPPPPHSILFHLLQKVMLMWSDQISTCSIRSKVEYSETCINRQTTAGPSLVSV